MVKQIKEACDAVMGLAGEAMQIGDYKRAEQIVRDGFYTLSFDEYRRSIYIYRGIKKWAEENQCEQIAKETLSELLKLTEEQQKRLCNFDQEISPLILRIRSEGEKK